MGIRFVLIEEWKIQLIRAAEFPSTFLFQYHHHHSPRSTYHIINYISFIYFCFSLDCKIKFAHSQTPIKMHFSTIVTLALSVFSARVIAENCQQGWKYCGHDLLVNGMITFLFPLSLPLLLVPFPFSFPFPLLPSPAPHQSTQLTNTNHRRLPQQYTTSAR